MKKRIAVCCNGWSNDYIRVVLSSIRECAKENNVDLFVLMNYSFNEGVEYKDIGEANIFRLLDYGEIDGVILLANTFHLEEEFSYLCEKIKSSHIPAISLEYQLPDIAFMGSDNYSGMYEMCSHIVEEHGAKDVLFISGPEGNPESDIRRKALEDVLAKNGSSLTEGDIIYGNWNYLEVSDRLPAWLEKHTKLPDAIVCANDIMAMAACLTLKERNIRVPEDVIVTGFDHLETAMEFEPMIATVDRNWNDMGYQSLLYLLDKIENKSECNSIYIKSKAVPAKSCGCELMKANESIAIKEEKGKYDTLVSITFWGGHLCDISECMTKVTSDEDLHDMYNKFLEKEHKYEGEALYVCLVDDFFATLKDDTPLRKRGYTEKIDVICGLKDGMAYDRAMMDTKYLIPEYDINSEGGKNYVFLPLYDMEGCYGYVAFGDEVDMMYDYSLYNWLRNLKQSLGYVRQSIKLVELNNRLSKLSITDGLTGVYNRMGCEGVAYPYLEKCHQQGKNVVLMFADINKMKVINDKYGHLQGDLAICTVAKVIQKVLDDNWLVVRYGGDEFLMVGECTDAEQPQRLLNQIGEQLEKTAIEMQLPYKLRAGVGYVMITPEEKLNLSECLKKADEAMYLMKRKQHSEMGY